MKRLFASKLLLLMTVFIGVFVALGAACGDDDDEAAPSDGTQTTAPSATVSGNPAGDTDVGVTATSIKVGEPMGLTGADTPHQVKYAQGWEACFRMINDGGGINGREIEWVKEDTVWDPTNSLSVATKLVTQDKVFAIVGAQESFFQAGAGPYLEEQGVPNIGGDGLTSEQYAPAVSYPVGSRSITIGHGMGVAAYAVGMRNIAIVSLELPGELGVGFTDGIKEAFESKGGKVAYTQFLPFGSTEQSAALLKAQSEGVDGMVGNFDIGNLSAFGEASQSLGYYPEKGWVSFGALDFFEDLSAQTDVWPKLYAVSSFNTVWTQDPSNEMKLFMDSMDKYFPDSGAPAIFTYHAWVGCRMFEKLIKDLGDNVTRAGLLDAISNLKDWDSGMGPTYTWKDNSEKIGNRGFAVVGAEDGKITQVTEWQADSLLKN